MPKSQRFPFVHLSISTLSGLLALTFSLSFPAYAEPTRAILLTPVQGAIPASNPQTVKLEIVQGEAKGCTAQGTAFLNPKRLRYEYDLMPINCVKNGQRIPVGQVVRGQHNIKGTMANSGMGRDYLISNKGVTVTLAHQ
ncbi:MAG: hypothetical protein R3189_06880 [Thiomicrorhabdus chilensis]|uniref:hypothetical protein n=1 Tax=Thiomicrorhabdus chilensis TaxID=63656 RepID=UPI00299CD758|nr:hypothetical protein [Thiomicrorhabdus chilensis]MDX1347955.1 hypothetical protein [Thiomicrorhabdus chilensis]